VYSGADYLGGFRQIEEEEKYQENKRYTVLDDITNKTNISAFRRRAVGKRRQFPKEEIIQIMLVDDDITWTMMLHTITC
jgi:hypothetical protein